MTTSVDSSGLPAVGGKIMTKAEALALARIAPIMKRLKRKADAEPGYDMMSDGLIWTDEIPFPDGRVLFKIPNWSVIRFVFHSRTRLILGEPINADYRQICEEAKRRFPKWPGFALERSSSRFADLYYELRAVSRCEWKEIMRAIRLKKS
jgi:hypothetical protein